MANISSINGNPIVVGSDGITNRSVSNVKLAANGLLAEVRGMSEVLDWTSGGYIVYSSGNVVSAGDYWHYTDYVEVVGGGKVHVHSFLTGNSGIAFYNANKMYISGVMNSGGTSPYEYSAVLDVPKNARYARLSCTTGVNQDIDTVHIVPLVSVSINALGDIALEKLDALVETPALTWNTGGYVNYVNGAIAATNSFNYTDFFEVVSGASYHFYTAIALLAGFAFYDSDYQYIVGYGDRTSTTGFVYDSTVAAPSNARYCRVSWYAGFASQLPRANVTVTPVLFDSIQSISDRVAGIEQEVEIGDYITCWGDSLTAMGGWTTRLAKLSGRTVYNAGTGGEDTATIAARQGGDVMMVNDITIPASGSVTIATLAEKIPTQLGDKARPLQQGGSGHVNPCRIGDIVGTLAWTGSSSSDLSGTWTFTRSTDGEAVVIDRPTALRTAYDMTRNAPYLMTIFMGTNGQYHTADLDYLVERHKQMIAHANAKHVIVLGMTYSAVEDPEAYEARMESEFGRYFINLREYLAHPIYDSNETLVSCYGLDDLGLTATEDDLTDIAAGRVPPQLRIDAIHYTTACRTIIGDLIYKRCRELNIF